MRQPAPRHLLSHWQPCVDDDGMIDLDGECVRAATAAVFARRAKRDAIRAATTRQSKPPASKPPAASPKSARPPKPRPLACGCPPGGHGDKCTIPPNFNPADGWDADAGSREKAGCGCSAPILKPIGPRPAAAPYNPTLSRYRHRVPTLA